MPALALAPAYTAFEVKVYTPSQPTAAPKTTLVASEQKGLDELAYWKRRGYAAELYGGGNGQYDLLATA